MPTAHLCGPSRGPPTSLFSSRGPPKATARVSDDFRPSRAATPEQAHDQGHQEQHGKYEEEDLRDLGRAGGNAAEPEQGRDQRDDEKYKRIVKHVRPFDLSRCRPREALDSRLHVAIVPQRAATRYRQASFSAVGVPRRRLSEVLTAASSSLLRRCPAAAGRTLSHWVAFSAYACNGSSPIAARAAVCDDDT